MLNTYQQRPPRIWLSKIQSLTTVHRFLSCHSPRGLQQQLLTTPHCGTRCTFSTRRTVMLADTCVKLSGLTTWWKLIRTRLCWFLQVLPIYVMFTKEGVWITQSFSWVAQTSIHLSIAVRRGWRVHWTIVFTCSASYSMLLCKLQQASITSLNNMLHCYDAYALTTPFLPLQLLTQSLNL